MARPSLLETTNLIALDLADNTTGAITPVKLRDCLNSIIQAIRPAYGILTRIGPTAQTPPVGAPAPVVFDTGQLSPIVDYSVANPAGGQIIRLEKGTTRLTFTADITPTANANNSVVFTLYKNGVATSWKQSVMLTATNVTESLSFPMIEYLNAAATYEIRVSATAAVAMNFSNMSFVAETVPVWDYT